jgi:hypothetical protein
MQVMRPDTWRRPGIWPDTAEHFQPPTTYAGYSASYRALAATNQSILAGSAGAHDPGLFRCYLYCIVWGMINLSGINVVKPETHLQSISSLFVVLLSIATNALIIGSITTTITQSAYGHRRLPYVAAASPYCMAR